MKLRKLERILKVLSNSDPVISSPPRCPRVRGAVSLCLQTVFASCKLTKRRDNVRGSCRELHARENGSRAPREMNRGAGLPSHRTYPASAGALSQPGSPGVGPPMRQEPGNGTERCCSQALISSSCSGRHRKQLRAAWETLHLREQSLQMTFHVLKLLPPTN